MNNPFSLSFGMIPPECIDRPMQTEELLETFLSPQPSQHVYMITGVRGSGKTVMLSEISARLQERTDWTVIALSPEIDMIHSLAAKLSSARKFRELFRDAKINLSLLGLGLEIDGVPPIADDETAIAEMLKSIQEKGGKVLIAIDEAINNEHVRIFSSVFQIWLRSGFPLFLIMTGLYESIYALQNEKSLTFLYRAPKISLQPLNYSAITAAYENTLGIDRKDAIEMARITKGYAFAFQVLGYFTFREPNHQYQKILPKFRLYLEEYVYEKLWSELSPGDRRVVICMAEKHTGIVSELRAHLNMSGNDFSQYRLRLLRKGVVDGSKYGQLTFPLPLFGEFVLDQVAFDNAL